MFVAIAGRRLRNRLGLARWLVDPHNPLTARVAVNRFWQRNFGVGLVSTTENFGVQGEVPSNPELLDWLATEFIACGWDVKHMLRLIVTSAAYRQSSTASPALLHRDPDNRLIARGPHFRLPAEVVRDNALAISGLLTERLFGPSVKPYQPAGLWEEMAGDPTVFGKYVQDKGPSFIAEASICIASGLSRIHRWRISMREAASFVSCAGAHEHAHASARAAQRRNLR